MSKACATQSRKKTPGPSLVTVGRQQDLEPGGKKPNPGPKEEDLFISTFDLDRRHIALFQRSVSGLDATSMPLAGGREASGSHGFYSFPSCYFACSLSNC